MSSCRQNPVRKAAMGLSVSAVLIAMSACSVAPPDASETKTGSEQKLTTGDTSQLKEITDFCGDKPMKVALADGQGGNAWRKVTRAEFEDEASRCDNIEVLPYADGQNNPQKAISDVNALVAQGVNGLVVFPDSGPAMLPTFRTAFKAGVSVVPYTSNPGGTPGVDYTTFVSNNTAAEGGIWAAWMCQTLQPEGGNIVFLGGTPGNTQSLTELEAVEEEMASNSDCGNVKLLNKSGQPYDTNWEPTQGQKVVAGLLTQHQQIDGIISDSSQVVVAGLRAVKAAKRSTPAIATVDLNELSCLWETYEKAGDAFPMMSIDGRPWLVRIALRKAVADFQGIDNDEPNIVTVPIFEDTTDDSKPVRCEPSLPPEASVSSTLDPEQLQKVFN